LPSWDWGYALSVEGSLRISGSKEAAALFAPTFSHAGIEELRIAHVDDDRRLIALRIHPGGSEDHLHLPLKEIAREALVLRSHGILMAHNHPSGDPTPSRSDIDATRALSELTERLDIRLYDHLIFAPNGWSSLLALGLL
jgi:DNA repair protein RadC